MTRHSDVDSRSGPGEADADASSERRAADADARSERRGADVAFRSGGTEAELETLERACEECRLTFEYQVQRLREIDSKAIEILKANLLIIGVLVTAVSIAIQSGIPVDGFVNPFTATGAGLLLVSTAIAGATYTSSNLTGGVGRDAVERTIAAGYSQREFYEVLARSYGEWIEYNSEVTAVNDILVTATVILVVDAFVLLSAGLGVAFVDPGYRAVMGAFVALLVPLGIVSWVVYQMDYIAAPTGASRPTGGDGP